MALKTVTGKVSRPDGSAGVATVRIVLSQPAVIIGTQEVVPAAIDAIVASDGTYSVQLQANNDMTPNGTSYMVSEYLGGATYSFTIIVPQTAGPFVMANLVVVSPAALLGGTNATINAAGDIAARSLTLSASGPYANNLPGNSAVATPAGVSAGKVWDYGGYDFNLKGFGANIGDGQLVTDGAMTSGSAILTSASGKFVATDVGKLITCAGAGAAGVTLYTTISSYQSATQVTLAATNSSGGSVTAQNVYWGTDCLAAFNLARGVALPIGATITMSAGIYMTSGQWAIAPAASATNAGTIVPSLVAETVAGRIGDVPTDLSSVTIVPAGAFPAGTLVLDYVSLNNANALLGGQVRGISFACQGVAAGVRISNARRFKCADLNIDHAATPTLGGAVTAAFNVLQQSGTPCAYSYFENIVTSYSGLDGIVHNANADDTFISCIDLNSTRYAFQAQGFARWIACHYEHSQYGVVAYGGNGVNVFVGMEFFGLPTSNAVQVTANASATNPVQFLGCWFSNAPGAAPGEGPGAIARIQDNGFAVTAQFIGCFFRSSANTTDYVYVDAAVRANSKVEFIGCNFTGAVTTNKYSDASGNNVLGFYHSPGIIATNDGIIPSRPAYVIRKSDNSADNLSVTDATGATVVRGSLAVGANAVAGSAGDITASRGGVSPGTGAIMFGTSNALHYLYYNGAALQSTDELLLPASTTAVASLNVPHGVAPTSPVNGDIWTTTAGMFVRINGVTKSVNLT